jgi:sorting nexin-4
LDYRCRALRKFLSRVGAHPHLYNSTLLKDFLEMDDVEWERRTKTPSKMAGPDTGSRGFLSTVSGTAGQWMPTAGGGANDGSLTGSFSKNGNTTSPGGGAGGLPMWEETKQYVGQLETSISMLRDRLEVLVKRRKETSGCLLEFGKAFSRVGELEALMEMDNGVANGLGGGGGSMTDGGLGHQLVAVGKHTEGLSQTFVDHGDDETKKVIETLVYYQGICDAVKDALKRLTNGIADRDSFLVKVKVAEGSLAKVTQVSDPVKRAQQEADLTAKRDDVTAKRDALIKHVINFEILFKEELRRFHREKQYDMKSMLKTFVELQVDYANKMKTNWEQLLPGIQAVIDIQLAM